MKPLFWLIAIYGLVGAEKCLAQTSGLTPQAEPQTALSVPAPVSPPVYPKQALRNAAKGEKLAQLVTTKRAYQGVTIKLVDPAAINIVFDAGAARIPFQELDQSWKDRFQYDPEEAKAFLAKKTAQDAQAQVALQKQLDATGQAQLEQQLAIAAQHQTQKPKQLTASNIAEIRAHIADLERRLEKVKKRNRDWTKEGHRGDIPNDISSAAIQGIERKIEDEKFELSVLEAAP